MGGVWGYLRRWGLRCVPGSQEMWGRTGRRVGPCVFRAHLVTFCNTLQHMVALSSGVAGFNAHVLCPCDALGAASLCEFWGLPCVVGGVYDSSAARVIANRLGVGKLNDFIVKQMWAQETVGLGMALLGRLPRAQVGLVSG